MTAAAHGYEVVEILAPQTNDWCEEST